MSCGEAGSSTLLEGCSLHASRRWEGMHLLRLLRTADVERFCAFLGEVHVRVDAVEGQVVTASIPGALTSFHEGRELQGYVTTWNALNPAAPVELIGEDDSAA